jgi:hypothetical protein
MGPKPDGSGLKWTVISIPSTVKRTAEEPSAKHDGRKPRHEHAAKAAETPPALPSASAALERLEIPPDMADRIGAMIVPGSSLIVSDNKLSSETGETTDFIVLTPYLLGKPTAERAAQRRANSTTLLFIWEHRSAAMVESWGNQGALDETRHADFCTRGHRCDSRCGFRAGSL